MNEIRAPRGFFVLSEQGLVLCARQELWPAFLNAEMKRLS